MHAYYPPPDFNVRTAEMMQGQRDGLAIPAEDAFDGHL
jgi:hypothetical protein